jgi:tripartite-type tricarboxylate transporter receptor subunit TctC
MLRATRCLLVILLSLAASNVIAGPYPDRPVRIILPYPAGSLTDTIARSVSQSLQEKFGQPFVVENMPGASGTIGSMHVSRSAPDGYTLLANPSIFIVTPLLMNVRYDVVKDFTPITNFGLAPLVVALNSRVPAKTLSEFITISKAAPEKFSWALDGFGAPGHLAAELIQLKAQTKMVMVPYKGNTPAVTDLVGGHVSAMVAAVPNVISHFRGGAIRPVAIAHGKRLGILPDVPTLAEAGLGNIEMNSWYAFWGPANMPTEVVETLSKAIAEATRTPRIIQPFIDQGLVPVGSSPAEFSAFQEAEISKYKQIIKDANINLENPRR